jgi:superfamily II DNA or RNA helicase
MKIELSSNINLAIEKAISDIDAKRQSITAAEILNRFNQQPGVILADEVGMGKTYVALAVAVSIYEVIQKPIVIMIPANLYEKWPTAFNSFINNCMGDVRNFKCKSANNTSEFLKAYDDKPEEKTSIIFLKHGAFNNTLTDPLIKLAIIQRAIKGRKDVEKIRKLLVSNLGVILQKTAWDHKDYFGLWEKLLMNSTTKWRSILSDTFNIEFNDDPIPEAFINFLNNKQVLGLNEYYEKLQADLPRRKSKEIKDRLRELRRSLTDLSNTLWNNFMKDVSFELPLLIFDEAHHLKNSKGQRVTKMFGSEDAANEAGILANKFSKMLFLTATPFQLGHLELVNVLKRFSAVKWNDVDKGGFTAKIFGFEKDMNLFQHYAMEFEKSWAKLNLKDFEIDFSETNFGIINEEIIAARWNNNEIKNQQAEGENLVLTRKKYEQLREWNFKVSGVLKQYIIRHVKPLFLPGNINAKRRLSYIGNQINDESIESKIGIKIQNESLLPFLLAGRLTALHQSARPVYAEGLSSSYQALLHCKAYNSKQEENYSQEITDTDDDTLVKIETNNFDERTSFYLEQLKESVQNKSMVHPKISASVKKAMELWNRGEKVVIFCHYIATVNQILKTIASEMDKQITKEASKLFSVDKKESRAELQKFGERLVDKNTKLGRATEAYIRDLISPFNKIRDREAIVEIALKFINTPSFILRFIDKKTISNLSANNIELAFSAKDSSGLTFTRMIIQFLTFLSSGNGLAEQDEFISALKDIRITKNFTTEDNSKVPIDNVEKCIGATSTERRQKLMRTFNTPFYPDILICSNVMSEGVDFHLFCRHIIHHDLNWNPSSLEQRIGRIDRIGSKMETTGQPVIIYYPYIAETQDEKMYKVVSERGKWFNIVMGTNYKDDSKSTEEYAERIPLPKCIVDELQFNLGLV